MRPSSELAEGPLAESSSARRGPQTPRVSEATELGRELG